MKHQMAAAVCIDPRTVAKKDGTSALMVTERQSGPVWVRNRERDLTDLRETLAVGAGSPPQGLLVQLPTGHQ